MNLIYLFEVLVIDPFVDHSFVSELMWRRFHVLLQLVTHFLLNLFIARRWFLITILLSELVYVIDRQSLRANEGRVFTFLSAMRMTRVRIHAPITVVSRRGVEMIP